jgi:hypothetical protein
MLATVCALLVHALPAQATSLATFVSSNGTDGAPTGTRTPK